MKSILTNYFSLLSFLFPFGCRNFFNFTFKFIAMERRIVFITVILLVVISPGSFGQNAITIDLENFNSLSVSGRIDLELIPSDSREMSIVSGIGREEEVSVEVNNERLQIKARPKIDKEEAITIRLPYTSLVSIEAAAGAVVNSARNIDSDEIELIANTGGKIELSVNSATITVRVSQVSDIILYGNTVSQHVSVTTGGNYLAYDLDCQDTYVKVSAGSQAKVTASRIIEATANSKGYIGFVGDPVSTYTKTSLGGEIASFKSRPEDDEY